MQSWSLLNVDQPLPGLRWEEWGRGGEKSSGYIVEFPYRSRCKNLAKQKLSELHQKFSASGSV